MTILCNQLRGVSKATSRCNPDDLKTALDTLHIDDVKTLMHCITILTLEMSVEMDDLEDSCQMKRISTRSFVESSFSGALRQVSDLSDNDKKMSRIGGVSHIVSIGDSASGSCGCESIGQLWIEGKSRNSPCKREEARQDDTISGTAETPTSSAAKEDAVFVTVV